jgi:long-chain acyl-CoA synthetase
MYEAQHPSDWRYIINDSGASIVFCATQDIYNKVQEEVLSSAPGVHASLCLDAQEGDAHAFATAMRNANDSPAGHYVVYPPSEGDLANLIYTSGTTGRPKGVELTHLNITSNIKAAGRKMVGDPRDLVSETDRSLAFLPWAHSYGQTCELWMGMSMGASMGICRGVPSILEDLQLVKPSILFAVPTLYKKVYDGVCNLIERPENTTQSALLKSAIGIGRANADLQQGLRGPFGPLEKIKFHLLDRLVLSKIRNRFGGNLKYGCVAGAACPPEVLRFMDSVGIPICEGYGLTETSPIITLNTPQKRSVGSVGQPIPDVTVYIIDEDGKPLPPGEEGEICCVGPNIMKGYYNNQEATDEVISVAPDGKSRM